METILATKLHMPAPRADLVPRTALLGRLNGGLQTGARLTLVSASAGYGKTTLVCGWIAQTGCRVSWLSLDAQDNEPSRFFSYLTAALQKATAPISQRTLDAVREVMLLPVEAAASIADDLTQMQDRLFIVLDDYHVIESGPIHQSVQLLAGHLPPAVHLVLITRVDPPIAISRLRASGQVTEIRIEDLRFSPSEAAAFFAQTMRLNLGPEKVQTLERRTEGWVAGLQLAALAIRNTAQNEVDAFVNEFGGNHKYIIDYLVEEVLAHIRPQLYQFLTVTSLLERFCAPLCDDVLGTADSSAILLELEKSNLFLMSLDETRVWFRYHRLFADSLASRLTDSQKNSVYLRASEWFDRNGYPREAAEYAFLSGNSEHAFRMVEKAKTHLFEHGPLPLLVQWLDRFPDERVLQSEPLSVNKAVAYLLTGEFQKLAGYMRNLDDAFFARASSDNKARILYLRAHLLEAANPQAALHIAREGLAVMSDADAILKSATMNIEAGILLGHGPATEAAAAAQTAYQYGLAFDNSFNTMVSLSHYANSLNLMLRRREAICCLQEYLKDGIKKSIAPPSSSGILYVTLGTLQYEANELDEADANITRGLELYRRMGSFWLGKLGPVSFLSKYALGRTDEALQALQAYATPGYLAGTSFDFNISALRAYVAMLQGNLADAQKWADDRCLSPDLPISPATEAPATTYARLLVMQGNTAGALQVLGRIQESALAGGRTTRLIPVFLLSAVAMHQIGRGNDALCSLNRAIELASQGDYYRAFLDEPEILPLLAESKYPSATFVQTLLNLGKINGQKPGKKATGSPFGLSARELEILREIAFGLSNQEISDKLFISLNTVQWHISHIFAKLGVKNRIGAVKKAQEEQII